MTPRVVMVVAGDPSGDALAADLVKQLDNVVSDPIRFIGAGGPKMAEAGVALEFDLTKEAVIGLDFIKKLFRFIKYRNQLVRLACEQKPELIVLVDYSGFNHRLARALRKAATGNWRAKIVKYVSPQVWASRPGRADTMAQEFDLLLCLFPFEKGWYAKRVPQLRVEFVGHPMFDKYGPVVPRPVGHDSVIALLPGSRRAELTRHLPIIYRAAQRIQNSHPSQFKMTLPSKEMVRLAEKYLTPDTPQIETTVGDLEQVLRSASIAIASTGTITTECAYFGVPTVAMYKTSLFTYLIGRQIVQVKYLAMPNLLADALVFPEFIQYDATPVNIADAALKLLKNPERRQRIQSQLGEIIETLGGSGASQRAAEILADMFDRKG